MRVLLIKTSSMGDLVHTLPALSDAGSAIPDIRFDWVVEDGFAEIPALHPLVDQIIPISLRRWRKGIFSAKTRQEWRQLKLELRKKQYDLILDAQGLVKSAFLMLLLRGKCVGLDWSSARESLASIFYDEKCTVNFYQHAVVRMRQLFSQAFKYPLPNTPPNFALDRSRIANDQRDAAPYIQSQSNIQSSANQPYIVFLHGTTWQTKLWPEQYWQELAKMIAQYDVRVKISGGNEEELARARRIAQDCEQVDVLPRLSIMGMASLLANARGVVALDTGFAHLAAALSVPTISLYGATSAQFTGAIGAHSLQLSANHPCAPCLQKKCTYKGPALVKPACFGSIPPTFVWRMLRQSLS